MGMYTELNISLELKQDVPQEVINILMYMTTGEWPAGVQPTSDVNLTKEELPDHPLFATDTRWRFMLRGNSYYFDMTPQHVLRYDAISEACILSVRSNFKNYDDEINKFLNWIEPYTETKGFIGYSRYEESDNPVLIHF